MATSTFTFGDYLLLSAILLHLYLCPFTKVEESFNMQAMNDFLTYNINLSQYDHLLFPGVVPRTFIGALSIAILSYIPSKLMECSAIWNLYLCRGMLGLVVWYSFVHVRKAISIKYGTRVAFFFSLLLSLQFHIPFYSTRSLPNIFAVIFTNHSFAYWLKSSPVIALCLVGIAMIIFRCDMLILLAPMALVMLSAQEINFFSTLLIGILVCLIALLVTVVIDSYFWQRLLWAEGTVLYFNGVENKSSEWGVSPWHWYFTSAIPRALQLSLPFTLFGLTGFTSHFLFKQNSSVFSPLSNSLRYYITPYLLFVILYSFLPHKELRFIFPIFAPLTLSAALGLHHVIPLSSSSPSQSIFQKLLFTLLWFGLGVLVVGMIVVTTIFSMASIHNYPGGDALSSLHRHMFHSFQSPSFTSTDSSHPPDPTSCSSIHYSPHDVTFINPTSPLIPFIPHSNLQQTVCSNSLHFFPSSSYFHISKCHFSIHIDAASAIAGITRFQELSFPSNPPYFHLIYSKNESNFIDYSNEFDWLIRGLNNLDENQQTREEIQQSFHQIYSIYTFSGFTLHWKSFSLFPMLSFLLNPYSGHSSSSPSPFHLLCHLHQQHINDPLPYQQIPLFGPLAMKFIPTHGIYRNKKLLQNSV